MVRRRPGGSLLQSNRVGSFKCLSLLLAFGLLGASSARADIGILLSDPTGRWLFPLYGSRTRLIYLSDVCPASPIRLRLCAPGEQGSVISNYSRLGEDKPYEWNIIPLSIFLYGFDNPSERPLVASLPLKRALEEQYRKGHLGTLCGGPPCTTNITVNWRDVVATTFVRGIYLFAVRRTVAQDEKFIEDFNSRANVNHYNGIRNNCADFARRVIAAYFPKAASPDYINDFGMTSPKAIVHSFSHFAEKKPALGFYVTRFAQLPSDRKPTGDARAGTDAMLHQKKWVLPLLLLRGYELPIVGATYALTGRFNPAKEERKYPLKMSATEDLASTSPGLRNRKDGKQNRSLPASLPAEQRWQQYRERFAAIVDDAHKSGIDTMRKDMARLMESSNRLGTISVDETGASWMTLSYKGQPVSVGVSSGNILALQSDTQLAFALQLAKVDRFPSAKPRYRESLKEFEQDWALLERLRAASGEKNNAQHVLPTESTAGLRLGDSDASAPMTPISSHQEF